MAMVEGGWCQGLGGGRRNSGDEFSGRVRGLCLIQYARHLCLNARVVRCKEGAAVETIDSVRDTGAVLAPWL